MTFAKAQATEFDQRSVSTTKLQDFFILEKIGDGAYSEVFKVRRLNDKKIYALKKVGLTKLLS